MKKRGSRLWYSTGIKAGRSLFQRVMSQASVAGFVPLPAAGLLTSEGNEPKSGRFWGMPDLSLEMEVVMKKKTIAVIFGGHSTEYEVSLQSAFSVLENLNAEKYHIIMIGITREGEWYRYRGSHENIRNNTWFADSAFLTPVAVSQSRSVKGFLELVSVVSDETSGGKDSAASADMTGSKDSAASVDMSGGKDSAASADMPGSKDSAASADMSWGKDSAVSAGVTAGRYSVVKADLVFPVLHGKNGEDGTLQGLFELAGIPVVGCNTLSSALCMDKGRAHTLARAAGVAVPKAVTFRRYEKGEALREIARRLHYPLFVKPVRAGSSFGITKVLRETELDMAIESAFVHDEEVTVEEAVEGFEVGCAVLGNETLTVGRVDEIELSEGFFDYTEKYTLKTSRIHMPARIDAQTERRIQETAETVYRALGCSGFARVDMFLTPDGEIVFNEVNTIPGCTSHSRYPNMMRGIGLSFADMLDRLIGLYME